MIALDAFSKLITPMFKYYQREIPESVLLVWYKHISANLTYDEFKQAVEAAIVNHAFLPTPAEFVALVKGSDDQNAADEWEKVLKAAARGSFDGLEPVSLVADEALKAIGGLHRLGMATEDRLPWLKKEFLESWKSARKVAGTAALNPDRALEGRNDRRLGAGLSSLNDLNSYLPRQNNNGRAD